MNFELSMEDYTIILNALHYYKKVEKRGNFSRYDDQRINQLRDNMTNQLVTTNFSFTEYEKIITGNENKFEIQ
jgi:hypothetical protein